MNVVISESEIAISNSEIKEERVLMKKRGLKDIKRRNRQLILKTVLDNGGLSRVEIAEKTELAVSTVSTLIGELIADGFLIESGNHTITAGRSRTELTINPKYGRIAVIEISRKEVCMTMFDMALQSMGNRSLTKQHLDGNELYDLIAKMISSYDDSDMPLAGIGLLFQEDMQEGDFRVMYSTGIASASITLKEALMSQFRIPIIEEFSQVYTITQAMVDHVDLVARNNAHISIGTSVFATVTIEGKTMPLRSDSCEMINSLVQDPNRNDVNQNSVQIGNLIIVLCTMFSLHTIFISGVQEEEEKLIHELSEQISQKLTPDKKPEIRLFRLKENRLSRKVLAQKTQMEIIFAN